MSHLDYNDRVVLVTGAGGGLGKTYCLLFASRGAKVVVNDFSKENADKVVHEIKAHGGQALANYDSVTAGDKIIAQIMQAYGRIDVIVNNAGILRDKSFKAMSDAEFNSVQEVHVKGAFSVTKAAWPHMRKAKYGRILNTASAAGIYGSFGQANYSAAKFALVTFAKTLAREGVKYNIHANAIAPIAASPMTATIMPPDVLENLKPEHVAPVVAWLCHESCPESGKLYETGAGWTGQVKWELSEGAIFKPDATFTPSAVAAQWKKITDFSNPSHPESQDDTNLMAKVEAAQKSPPNKQGEKVDFKGKVVLVTGAGAGIGRGYALMYAKLGAKVCVNDFSEKNANAVVDEIKQLGAEAVAVVASVEDGQKVVQACVDAFGTLHVVVNNAGILRDKSFAAMTEKEWDDVYNIHLKGSYQVAHAAWPIFLQQKYGRIVNTSSIVGVHGNFGQANYSSAKAGLIAFSKTLALEGKKYNILVNCLVPTAGTAMTATVWPKEMLETFKPEYIAPAVGYLTSEACKTTGGLFAVSGGWVAQWRWIRTGGVALSNKKFATPEQIRDAWPRITKFDERATHPSSTQEAMADMMNNFGNEGTETIDDPEDSDLVRNAKRQPTEPLEYSWTEKDTILYNLGIGASAKELKYTFEGSTDFQAIPTFGVIPQFGQFLNMPFDWLPNFSPMMLLHGEQYLELKKPMPTSGSVKVTSKLLEVLDKGKAAAVCVQTETVDNESGELLAVNESTVFIRGAGGFGGKKTGSDRGAATAVNKPPSRQPDAVSEFKTDENQAAIYRLSGDPNPLHIDPEFSKVGGFPQPILHGLAFFGICGKAILDKYGPYSSIKARFAGHLFPSETVQTLMWREGDKVIFVAKCKERNTVIISNAAVTLSS